MLVGCISVVRHLNSQCHITAVGDLHVFPGFLTSVLTRLSFQSRRLLFSHASAEVKSENTPQRKSIRYRTHNHQVTSPTWSLQSRPGISTLVILHSPRWLTWIEPLFYLQNFLQAKVYFYHVSFSLVVRLNHFFRDPSSARVA